VATKTDKKEQAYGIKPVRLLFSFVIGSMFLAQFFDRLSVMPEFWQIVNFLLRHLIICSGFYWRIH